MIEKKYYNLNIKKYTIYDSGSSVLGKKKGDHVILVDYGHCQCWYTNVSHATQTTWPSLSLSSLSINQVTVYDMGFSPNQPTLLIVAKSSAKWFPFKSRVVRATYLER